MEKITTTTYDTIDPYQWVTDLAHEAWKARDLEVWDNNLEDLIASDAVILDAGCGLGRLLPRLWSAKKNCFGRIRSQEILSRFSGCELPARQRPTIV